MLLPRPEPECHRHAGQCHHEEHESDECHPIVDRPKVRQHLLRVVVAHDPLSDDPQVVPDAHRTKADVEVAEANPEEAGPGPVHVPAIDAARAVVCVAPRWLPADLIYPDAAEL